MMRIRNLIPERTRLLVRSIRFRLALWFAAILAVVLAAFSGFVYARQASDMEQETLDRLASKTREWEGYLKYVAREYFDENRPLIPNETRDGEPFIQERDILALAGPQGEVVQKLGQISDEDVQRLVNLRVEEGIGQNRAYATIVEASAEGKIYQEEYRFVVAPISINGRLSGFFVLGSPVDPTGLLQRLLLTLLLGNMATLGLALAGGYLLADRAMRPVKMITRAAREIGETDLSRRINLGTQDELGELAGTFDQMLSRLQAAFDRQRQFTADASHELRTPLTIVSLEASRALASRRTPQEYESAFSIIQSENEFMTCLVNNLLTLSRMDAGQTVMNCEELDLSDVALEVVERLTPLAERRGVALSTGDLPELKVRGDRQFLSQMISNLVENAIKYSRQAGQFVRVETGIDSNGIDGRPSFGWVQVLDNGPGIAPDHLAHIFDRFYQVDTVRSHNAEELESDLPDAQGTAGSGLGLSIVQQIARAHGGEVSVQSEVNQGSIFSVRLPLADLSESVKEQKEEL